MSQYKDKIPEKVEVTELEDQALEGVAGGMATDLLPDIDVSCKDNGTCPTNSGNCVSGCACT